MFALELRAIGALKGKFKPAFETLSKPVWRYFSEEAEESRKILLSNQLSGKSVHE